MKKILFILSILVVGTSMSYAQKKTPVVEVSVTKDVQVQVNSATYNISVSSTYEQVSDALAYEDGYYYPYEYEELDWEYYYALEDDPKKVTKQMEKEYQERQKYREEVELKRAQYEETFKAFTIADLMDLLDKGGIAYKMNESNPEYEYYGEDYASLKVEIHSNDEYEKMSTIIYDVPAYSYLDSTATEAYAETLKRAMPDLLKEAKEQAEVLASALGKKVGDVVKCSTVVPDASDSGYDPYYYGEYYDGYGYEDGYYGDNVFSGSNTKSVSLIFQYELID